MELQLVPNSMLVLNRIIKCILLHYTSISKSLYISLSIITLNALKKLKQLMFANPVIFPISYTKVIKNET